jgi:hypothetical protein
MSPSTAVLGIVPGAWPRVSAGPAYTQLAVSKVLLTAICVLPFKGQDRTKPLTVHV